MTRIDADWIAQPGAQSVCRMLSNAGYQAYFVGGCVRNALLGAPISDIDLSTDALPETVMKLAKKAGFKPVPTGIDHGTVTVVVNGHPFEVTTFRKDVETDGRRAVVAYAKTLNEDAHRRDFTMNALFATPEGVIVDPLGGLDDLKARRVRFIDDPAQRIREDYLRILRFFRFHAWYGDQNQGLDPEGLAAICANLDGLETLSRERIGQEMIKLLSARDPVRSVRAMEQSGVLTRVLPGASGAILAVLLHLEQIHGEAPNPIRRLASLGGADHQDLLRLSKKHTRHLTALLDAAGGTMGPAELAYRHGAVLALDAVLLKAATHQADLPENLLRDLQAGAAAKFPVRAKDLMPDHKGTALGAKLKDLETAWIDSGFALSREELLR